MSKKFVIWGFGLVLVVAFSLPAFADQSIGFQEYFKEGVKAFEEHDDQKALRCFKIAQIYDPTDEDLNKYLDILEQRGVVLELPAPTVPPEQSIGYRYYLKAGIKAFRAHDNKEAIRYFEIALIFYPDSKEADRYLQILGHPYLPVVSQPVPVPQVVLPSVQTPLIQPQPAASVTQPLPSYSPLAQAQPLAVSPQPSTYVPVQNAKGPTVILSLAQLVNHGQMKPKLQLELHSSLIIEGKNIQRFLLVDENVLGVKTVDIDHLEIDALRIGNTFLHIWDDYGRHSIYVEVVFPKNINSNSMATSNVQHAQPFIVTYSNDWSTFYQGRNLPDLKRQSYYFNQTLAVTGETPYGFFDASGSYTDFDSFSQFDTYTIGLSQIPIEGTSNFSLRGFDAVRYLSPLTMPGTRLRGAFADIDLMDNYLGLSVSHGQEQEPSGFISMGASQFNDSYIDAVKLTLFPTSQTDRYSFNYATGYGTDRPSYLSDHVYSVEGQHKFNDFLTLNAEEANDSSHDSSLASLRWQQGTFQTGLNFRNVDKDYATVSTLPANQGETGAAWTTEGDFNNITESSFIEAYQEHLFSNPNDPRAFNYDGNAHLRADFTKSLWSDTDFNFVDTAGELSPQRNVQVNERLSRSFGIWNSLKGTFFGGTGFQDNQSPGSDISNFDREDVIAGIQLPLTNSISSYANYEYDWLDEPHDGGNTNPSVINAGLEYQKQLNPKFSYNAQLDYRDELGVNPNTSFLSGEQSVIISSGFTYNPTSDVSIFADGEASKIVSHIGNAPYDDFEVHVGVRITFGGATYWDPLGTVSGIIFKDVNGDGKYVTGDEGIPGVKVKVGDKEAVTDKYGHYSIQIRAKGVTVYPILDTVPGGLLFSTPQSLNVVIIQGRNSRANFGFTSQTGIYGIVFVDKNGTGLPKDNDKFIGKVRVILDGKIIQKSDSHGSFYFRKVSPGPHTLSIDINTLALNLVPLIKLENKIDVAEGTNYMFNIPLQMKKQEGEEE